MKTKLFMSTLSVLACVAAIQPAYAAEDKAFEIAAEKRIIAEADTMRQDNGGGYNAKGDADKKGFDTRTDRTAAELSDAIMQEEGRKYNEGK